MSLLKESPNKYQLPPLFTLAIVAISALLHWLVPIGWEAADVNMLMRSSGAVLLCGSLMLIGWALLTFRKHNANVLPNRAASLVLTSGPFALSRNPIYLGDVLLVAGIGLLLGSRWFLLGAVVLFFLLSELVIKREEMHLQANFPEDWSQYSKRVRRWI